MWNRRLLVNLVIPALLVAAASVGVSAQDDRESVRLTLDECLRIALENNLDLVSARIDPEISKSRVDQAGSLFDPTLTAGADHSESKNEISNLFSLNESENDRGTVGLSQQLPFGGDVSASLSGGRYSQSGPLVTAEVVYSSQLNLALNLPLLKGFGEESAKEQLILARGNLDISHDQLLAQVHNTLETVESAYWNVLAAKAALDVSRQSLQRAEDLLDLNRKKVEVGTLAPIEITQAEAGVANQEESVIIAETTLIDAEDELRRLLAVPDSDPMWAKSIESVDRPSYEEPVLDLESAIATALANRPDLSSYRQTLKNAALSERVARRDLRPGLDLSATYTPSGNNFETTFLDGPDGIPGTPDDVTINTTDGKLMTSLDEIPDFDNYNWTVGLNFRYAIGNRSARADHKIAKLNHSKAEIDLANQEQTIRVEVRRAVRAVESGAKRVEAAGTNVRLQREKLDAEQKKFENGMSTSFEVLTFQNDLASAELSDIRARLDFVKAKAALERVQGTLLAARGLSLGE